MYTFIIVCNVGIAMINHQRNPLPTGSSPDRGPVVATQEGKQTNKVILSINISKYK